jgi:hypothetical protein
MRIRNNFFLQKNRIARHLYVLSTAKIFALIHQKSLLVLFKDPVADAESTKSFQRSLFLRRFFLSFLTNCQNERLKQLLFDVPKKAVLHMGVLFPVSLKR